MNRINVSSEIGTLKKVIIHKPDEGIGRISPKKAEELLFDDIVHVPSMQQEHDIFSTVVKLFLGKENVLEIEDLLAEALDASIGLKSELLDMIIQDEELPDSYLNILTSVDNEQLTDILITGYYEEDDIYLFDPIPNFIFTRDIAVSVNEHLIITKAAKEARFRENLLTRFIFAAHPLFSYLKKEGKMINLNDINAFPPSKKGEVVSIEGGDMMIIQKDYLLIGCSERTTDHAIHSLKNEVFKKGVVKNVVQINIPNNRSFMHIDTIFTRIDEDCVVAFKPIIGDGQGSNVIVHNIDGTEKIYPTIETFFKKEINPNMKFIWSGNGESPYQEREQWTDGCNLVALKPGIGITYDRNPKTEEAFKENGFNVLTALDFIYNVQHGTLDPAKLEKTIITIPSSELSRARGGSHCMTCPIQRENV